MRASRRRIAVSLSIFSLLTFGIVGVAVESASASIPAAPSGISEVVSPSGTLGDAGCPTIATGPTVYSNLPAAIAAVSASNASNLIIYVCAGDYQLYNPSLDTSGEYTTNQDIVVNKPFVTIDGPNWAALSPSTSEGTALLSTSQAIIDGGSGIIVEKPNVNVNGLSFDSNNVATDSTYCGNTTATVAPGTPCSSSIDVQSFISGTGAAGAALSGAGDQGEANVGVTNNVFVDTGGNDWQNGVVHFGLGPDGGTSGATLVNALDAGDVANDNVFYQDSGSENNAVQMSDTTGAHVDGNTVNYATNDDSEITALWFPGYNQGTQVETNVLNGGNIDSDVATGCTASTGAGSTGCVNTEDPKSGIKFVDQDEYGSYGAGCQGQLVENNTVSGFVYDISMISADASSTVSGCAGAGPAAFTVSGNTLSNARVYGIFISNQTLAGGTISGNTVANTDTEYYSGGYFDLADTSYTTASYIPGDYDYFDQATPSTTETWTPSNAGNGFADPSSIGEVSNGPPPATTTTTSTSTTTTTTIAPPPATTTPTTVAIPPPVTTTPTTTPTTTTIAAKPAVSTSAATLKGASSVVTKVFCTGATCSGTLELTKSVTTRVEIGKTKKYKNKTTIIDLGKLGYTVAAGQSKSFTIHLNATGLKMAKSAKGSRYSCTLAITTSAGTTREGVSFKKP
jgi:hypothetical protein